MCKAEINSSLCYQVFVDGTVTTIVLERLNPLTEYRVNVYSVVGEESSEPLKGVETTRMFPLSAFNQTLFKNCMYRSS